MAQKYSVTKYERQNEPKPLVGFIYFDQKKYYRK